MQPFLLALGLASADPCLLRAEARWLSVRGRPKCQITVAWLPRHLGRMSETRIPGICPRPVIRLASTSGAGHSFCSALQVHVKSEGLAVKLSQEINYAKSLYYEQQLMLRLTENQERLELDS